MASDGVYLLQEVVTASIAPIAYPDYRDVGKPSL